MRWPLRPTYSPIGLDLGTHTLKAVQLVGRGSARTVHAAVALPRVAKEQPLTEEDVRRLRAVLQRRGFVGDDVVIAVPQASLLSTVLELPARAPGLPLEVLTLSEFARVNKLEPSALSMSTWELPPSARASRATYMLAVGAKAASLNAHLDLIESTGLRVLAADDPYSAIARGAMRTTTVPPGMTAVLDLGWTGAAMAILHNTTLVYTRRLADGDLARLCRTAVEGGLCDASDVEETLWRVGFGGEGPTEDAAFEVRDLLNSHFASTLREAGLALGYADHQYPDMPINQVLLTGGGAMLAGLGRRFGDAVGVKTAAAALAESVTPSLVPALGLSLWAEGGR